MDVNLSELAMTDAELGQVFGGQEELSPSMAACSEIQAESGVM